MNTRFFRRATLGLCTGALLACGGDNGFGPDANLSQEQVDEMMQAMSVVGLFAGGPLGAQAVRGQDGPQLAVFTESATEDCPNGGTASYTGTANVNDQTGNATAQITQNFSACKVTSASDREWTFNGSPNIQTNMTLTVNQQTEAFTLTATQTGGVAFSSDIASGRCSINISFSLATTVEGNVAVSANGTVCGRTVQYSYEETFGTGERRMRSR